MTKLSSNVCVRRVRVRGGNSKFRALRLDHGNFSWGSEVRWACWVLGADALGARHGRPVAGDARRGARRLPGL